MTNLQSIKNEINFYSCMQCITCSNGCPFSHIMNHPPHLIMRYLQLGAVDIVLKSNTPWICTGCNTCSAVCPMGIDIPYIFDVIKEHIIDNKLPVPEPKVLDFHKAVLKSIKKYGRTHKLEIMVNFKLKNRDFFTDFKNGLKMFLKNKIHILPPNFSAVEEIRQLFNEVYPKKGYEGLGK